MPARFPGENADDWRLCLANAGCRVYAFRRDSSRMSPAALFGAALFLRQGHLVKPVLQALVVAERVYEDKTGKKIIAGTFNAIKINRSPPVREVEAPDGSKARVIQAGMDGGSPWAYISLTDVWDNTELDLQFVSLRRNTVLFRTALTVRCNDRVATVEIVVPLPTLSVGESGTYAIEILCDGELIGSHRITAEEVGGSDPG